MGSFVWRDVHGRPSWAVLLVPIRLLPSIHQIDYINGYIVREAQRLREQGGGGGPRVPTHETLVRLVQAAERGAGGVGQGGEIK